jgi:hypothetical protein
MESFTDEEMEVVKRFLDRAAPMLDSDEGITGYDEDGVTLKEWSTDSDFDGGGGYLTSSECFIPWIAFTDIPEYDRQQKEAEEQRKREDDRRHRQYLAQREAQERAAYEALKAKFG